MPPPDRQRVHKLAEQLRTQLEPARVRLEEQANAQGEEASPRIRPPREDPDEKMDRFEDGVEEMIDELEDYDAFEDLEEKIDDPEDDEHSEEHYLARLRRTEEFGNLAEMYAGIREASAGERARMRSIWQSEWNRGGGMLGSRAEQRAYQRVRRDVENRARLNAEAERARSMRSQIQGAEPPQPDTTPAQQGEGPPAGQAPQAGTAGLNPAVAARLDEPVDSASPPALGSYQEASAMMGRDGGEAPSLFDEVCHEVGHYEGFMEHSRDAFGYSGGAGSAFANRFEAVATTLGTSFGRGFLGGFVEGFTDTAIVEPLTTGADRVLSGLTRGRGQIRFVGPALQVFQSGLIQDIASGNLLSTEGRFLNLGGLEHSAENLGRLGDNWDQAETFVDHVGVIFAGIADVLTLFVNILTMVSNIIATLASLAYILAAIFLVVGLVLAWLGVGTWFITASAWLFRAGQALSRLNRPIGTLKRGLNLAAVFFRTLASFMVPPEMFAQQVGELGSEGEALGTSVGEKTGDQAGERLRDWGASRINRPPEASQSPAQRQRQQGIEEGDQDGQSQRRTVEEAGAEVDRIREEGEQMRLQLDTEDTARATDAETRPPEGGDGERGRQGGDGHTPHERPSRPSYRERMADAFNVRRAWGDLRDGARDTYRVLGSLRDEEQRRQVIAEGLIAMGPQSRTDSGGRQGDHDHLLRIIREHQGRLHAYAEDVSQRIQRNDETLRAYQRQNPNDAPTGDDVPAIAGQRLVPGTHATDPLNRMRQGAVDLHHHTEGLRQRHAHLARQHQRMQELEQEVRAALERRGEAVAERERLAGEQEAARTRRSQRDAAREAEAEEMRQRQGRDRERSQAQLAGRQDEEAGEHEERWRERHARWEQVDAADRERLDELERRRASLGQRLRSEAAEAAEAQRQADALEVLRRSGHLSDPERLTEAQERVARHTARAAQLRVQVLERDLEVERGHLERHRREVRELEAEVREAGGLGSLPRSRQRFVTRRLAERREQVRAREPRVREMDRELQLLEAAPRHEAGAFQRERERQQQSEQEAMVGRHSREREDETRRLDAMDRHEAGPLEAAHRRQRHDDAREARDQDREHARQDGQQKLIVGRTDDPGMQGPWRGMRAELADILTGRSSQRAVGASRASIDGLARTMEALDRADPSASPEDARFQEDVSYLAQTSASRDGGQGGGGAEGAGAQPSQPEPSVWQMWEQRGSLVANGLMSTVGLNPASMGVLGVRPPHEPEDVSAAFESAQERREEHDAQHVTAYRWYQVETGIKGVLDEENALREQVDAHVRTTTDYQMCIDQGTRDETERQRRAAGRDMPSQRTDPEQGGFVEGLITRMMDKPEYLDDAPPQSQMSDAGDNAGNAQNDVVDGAQQGRDAGQSASSRQITFLDQMGQARGQIQTDGETNRAALEAKITRDEALLQEAKVSKATALVARDSAGEEATQSAAEVARKNRELAAWAAAYRQNRTAYDTRMGTSH